MRTYFSIRVRCPAFPLSQPIHFLFVQLYWLHCNNYISNIKLIWSLINCFKRKKHKESIAYSFLKIDHEYSETKDFYVCIQSVPDKNIQLNISFYRIFFKFQKKGNFWLAGIWIYVITNIVIATPSLIQSSTLKFLIHQMICDISYWSFFTLTTQKKEWKDTFFWMLFFHTYKSLVKL